MRLILKERYGLFVGGFAALDAGNYFTNDCDRNGELQQAPTARIGLLASSSLRVEPYTTPYAIVPHQ